MSPLDAALRYASRGKPVFPCRWDGIARKQPLTPHGFKGATTDTAIIRSWWGIWPEALIGMPTGQASGLVVLDIDVKQPEANGFDSLEDLGRSILPETPMVHTQSGGLHVYFAIGERELKNSAGRIGARRSGGKL